MAEVSIYREFNEFGINTETRFTVDEDVNMADALVKYGITYKNKLFAIACAEKIFEGWVPENCFVIGREDDGTIYFKRNDIVSIYWLDDLSTILAEFKEKELDSKEKEL